MHLERISITNYKNYERLESELDPGLNIILGINGAGKTNLLDAMYYLCMTKSYFSSSDAQVIRKNERIIRLEGRFHKNNESFDVVGKIQVGKKKSFECKGIAYDKLSEHVGQFPVVMIAPDDTLLAKEGSQERRRLLDNLLSQQDPNYLSSLIRYNKLLSQRNAYLKSLRRPAEADRNLLESFDEQMRNPAMSIFQVRQEYTRTIDPILKDYYRKISGGAEEVGCKYISQLEKDKFQNLVLKAREKDIILQRSTCGIHKDDLKFTINGELIKRFGSQGQLKSYILGLKIAQWELLGQKLGTEPILLIDDIFDKLDLGRVNRLFDLLLEEQFGQVCITDSHENRILGLLTGKKRTRKLIEISKGELI